MSHTARPPLLSLALILSLLPAPVGAQSSETRAFGGVWEGHLDTGASRLRLVFHVDVAADGGLSGTLDSPDQGANGIPATTVTVEAGTLTFLIAALGARYEATLSDDGSSLDGTFTQGPVSLPLTLARVDTPTEPERPQNPTEPVPYRAEEVVIANREAGVTLAGTLTLPPGAGPWPAAVLVSGSGPQDRDESLMGHKPFLVLADHLTRRGIAVVRYDDRGVGGSTGSFSTATSEDFSSDALAAVAFLHARDDIEAVGIVGHSEGGLVAPLAAARSDAVDFIVMLAGPGVTGAEIIQLQSDLIARTDGAPDAVVAANLETQRRLFEVVRDEPDPDAAAPRLLKILEESIAALPEDVREAMGPQAEPQAMNAQVEQLNSPWFRFFLSYDPRPALEEVRVPVLALNGSLDLQVPAEVNLREVRTALERGGNPDVTVKELPGLNHLFQAATTGSPAEYAAITETMNPAALEAVSSWILERFGRRR